MISSYTVALFCHIVGVLLFVSAIVLAGAAFEIARRRDDPAGIAAILGLARVAVPIVGLGAAMVFVFGIWLVHLGHFAYGAGWVQAAIALFVIALALGGFGGRRPKRARLRAIRLGSEGAPMDIELRRLLDDPLSRAANYASTVAIVVILGLMVFKP